MPKPKLVRDDTPILEWVVGGLGALLFAAVLGVLVKAGFDVRDAPPVIVLRVDEIVATDRAYVVQFVARNEGAVTAADVEIVARLGKGAEMEERRARIDYLPPHSERRGGLLFTRDPREAPLTLSADGYADP